MPYITIARGPKIDVIGKVVFDLLAWIGFAWLETKVYRQAATDAA